MTRAGRSEARGAALRVLVPLALLAGLAAAWQFTPLRESAYVLTDWVERLRHSPVAPLLVAAIYVVAGLLVAPLTALVLATVLTFGAVLGAVYAMIGSLSSAAALFAVGRLLGRASLERLLGPRLQSVAGALTRKGVLAVAVVRNIPLAPYSVVNVAAGASDIGLVPFLAGTFLGLLPGIVAFAAFGDGLSRFLRQPDLATGAILLAVVAGVVATSLLLARRLARSSDRAP